LFNALLHLNLTSQPLVMIGPSVGTGEFGAIAYAKTTPNGKTFTCASTTTTSCICLSLTVLI
jgi:hypothetical protein